MSDALSIDGLQASKPSRERIQGYSTLAGARDE